MARLGTLALVLAGLWALWEGYRWVWIETGWTRPFVVDSTTLPHLHDIVGALFEPTREGGPLLIDVLLDAALFTAKEAAVGFAIGATVGFLLGAVIARFQILQRGLMPYVVASGRSRSLVENRRWLCYHRLDFRGVHLLVLRP